MIYPGHLKKCEGALPHFWAKITPNDTIFSKIALELFGQNLLFCTFGSKLYFFTLFGKDSTPIFPTLFQMPCTKYAKIV